MHYVFKSRADADLIMMAPVGDHLLRIVGHEPSARGIIGAAALPGAIQAIESAIEVERRAGGGPDDDEAEGREARVGLAQRAWPLLEMMKRSLAEGTDIVWGV